MNDEIKNKVRNAVSLYKDIFRDEYNQVVKEIDVARKNLKTEYAEVVYEDGRPSEGVKRELWRIPEKLYSTIISNVPEKDWPALDSKEYAAWFMKEFPEFKMTSKH